MKVPDPHLWWPWDQGCADLYCLTARLIDKMGEECSVLSEGFGIREVQLQRSADEFVYLINDRPVFLRGTSYIPALYLSECNGETVKRDLRFVRKLNLNLLRLHVHVSPSFVYELCDRAGIMVWQDFELSWVHDASLAFEAEARRLQGEMITQLGNHPSIITWACHNEPTMVFARRSNLEKHPDPALYADAYRYDGSRPVFMCSGQNEDDWQRSGDAHCYYGATWSRHYTDVYKHSFRLNTEFGCEAPAALTTLQDHSECWDRLKHLEPEMDNLGQYQAKLIQFTVEHFRRLRATGCGGYIHFWLADLFPQVGWGVLDVHRQAKGGYVALQLASQPLHIALEHDGRGPRALWVFNDTPQAYKNCTLFCRVFDSEDQQAVDDCYPIAIAANCSARICDANWRIPPYRCQRVELELRDHTGRILSSNRYDTPFAANPRPRGYPWKFDRYLGCKAFDSPFATSLADQSQNLLINHVPLAVRERVAEWALRQRVAPWLLSSIAQLIDALNP